MQQYSHYSCQCIHKAYKLLTHQVYYGLNYLYLVYPASYTQAVHSLTFIARAQLAIHNNIIITAMLTEIQEHTISYLSLT